MLANRPDFTTLLRDELEALGATFAPNELAYLALTSKVELPVRDRVAFALHQRLDPLLVAREWQRTDLAVLSVDGTKPLLLLEAKALYTFDLVDAAGDKPTWVARYPALVAADLRKMCALAGAEDTTELFALVLATHPVTASAAELRQVVKYARPYAKALAALSADGVLERADAAIEDAVRTVRCLAHGNTGRRYGVRSAGACRLLAVGARGSRRRHGSMNMACLPSSAIPHRSAGHRHAP